MRDRHLPRLCRSCEAPMARQEDTCWRCGAEWVPDLTQTSPKTNRTAQARTDTDRWVNEGGSLGSDAPELDRGVAAGR
jgi:predicted amidophosphoribosyltransferase